MDRVDPTVDASSPAMDDLLPGTVVGEYRIERKLAVGGMGAVYQATHPVINKRAAVKVLHGHFCRDEEIVRRFVDEARAANQIGHRNIVDVFAFGTLPDRRSYFIMEWLDGQSLLGLMRARRIEVIEALQILEQLCEALSSAHQHGVLHRDVKPDNVFILSGSMPPSVRLVDFGIAKLAEGRPDRKGYALGTPEYISPEQARAEPVGPATDVYSLGVMAFELFVGRRPHEGRDASELLVMHAFHEAPAPRSCWPGMPPALDSLISKMLRKEAESRPSIAEVKRRLAELRAAAYLIREERAVSSLAGRPNSRPLMVRAFDSLSGLLEPVISELSSGLAWVKVEGESPPAGTPIVVRFTVPRLAMDVDLAAVSGQRMSREGGRMLVRYDRVERRRLEHFFAATAESSGWHRAGRAKDVAPTMWCRPLPPGVSWIDGPPRVERAEGAQQIGVPGERADSMQAGAAAPDANARRPTTGGVATGDPASRSDAAATDDAPTLPSALTVRIDRATRATRAKPQDFARTPGFTNPTTNASLPPDAASARTFNTFGVTHTFEHISSPATVETRAHRTTHRTARRGIGLTTKILALIAFIVIGTVGVLGVMARSNVKQDRKFYVDGVTELTSRFVLRSVRLRFDRWRDRLAVVAAAGDVVRLDLGVFTSLARCTAKCVPIRGPQPDTLHLERARTSAEGVLTLLALKDDGIVMSIRMGPAVAIAVVEARRLVDARLVPSDLAAVVVDTSLGVLWSTADRAPWATDEHLIQVLSHNKGSALRSKDIVAPDGTEITATWTSHDGLRAIVMAKRSLTDRAIKQVTDRVAQLALGSLAAAVLIGLVLARGLTRRLRLLTRHAIQVGQGDFTASEVISGHDEVGLLSRTLEDMTRALRARDEEVLRIHRKMSADQSKAVHRQVSDWLESELTPTLEEMRSIVVQAASSVLGAAVRARLEALLDRASGTVDHALTVVGMVGRKVDLAMTVSETVSNFRAQSLPSGVALDVLAPNAVMFPHVDARESEVREILLAVLSASVRNALRGDRILLTLVYVQGALTLDVACPDAPGVLDSIDAALAEIGPILTSNHISATIRQQQACSVLSFQFKAEDEEVSDDVDGQVGSGDVDDRTASGDVDQRTASGDVDGRAESGDFDGRAASGDPLERGQGSGRGETGGRRG